MSPEQDDAPEYGPRGYLSDRAARRARKIILRAPMGLQWIVAVVVAGVVVLVAGAVFLGTSGGPPGEPYVRAGHLEQLPAATTIERLDVLLVTAAGRPRAFPTGDHRLAYCPETRNVESPAGQVWNLNGRGLGGTPSLAQHPTLVHDGVVYVDPTTLTEAPPPAEEPVEPGCVGG